MLNPTIEGIYLVIGIVIPFAFGVYFVKEFIKWIKEILKKIKED